jgi:hypothetical protein
MIFPVIRILPTDQRGDTYNTLFAVVISTKVEPGASWPGILAQEIYECHFKWSRGALLHLLVKSWHEELKLRGHATEIAAYEIFSAPSVRSLHLYTISEARALLQYQAKGLFKGWSLLRAYDEVFARVERQKQWVRDHEPMLRSYWAKRNDMLASSYQRAKEHIA